MTHRQAIVLDWLVTKSLIDDADSRRLQDPICSCVILFGLKRHASLGVLSISLLDSGLEQVEGVSLDSTSSTRRWFKSVVPVCIEFSRAPRLIDCLQPRCIWIWSFWSLSNSFLFMQLRQLIRRRSVVLESVMVFCLLIDVISVGLTWRGNCPATYSRTYFRPGFCLKTETLS